MGLAPLAFGVTVLAGPAAVAGATPTSCDTAGTTGLTASVVASPGQRIDGGTIDATGCDVGIYVGPGVEHVVVDGVTVVRGSVLEDFLDAHTGVQKGGHFVPFTDILVGGHFTVDAGRRNGPGAA